MEIVKSSGESLLVMKDDIRSRQPKKKHPGKDANAKRVQILVRSGRSVRLVTEEAKYVQAINVDESDAYFVNEENMYSKFAISQLRNLL